MFRLLPFAPLAGQPLLEEVNDEQVDAVADGLLQGVQDAPPVGHNPRLQEPLPPHLRLLRVLPTSGVLAQAHAPRQSMRNHGEDAKEPWSVRPVGAVALTAAVAAAVVGEAEVETGWRGIKKPIDNIDRMQDHPRNVTDAGAFSISFRVNSSGTTANFFGERVEAPLAGSRLIP